MAGPTPATIVGPARGRWEPVSLFHVFIERPRSTAPGAVAALARAIADRYGIPAETLEPRLAKGRFRVKANVDRALADNYAHDLARLGAVCTIVSAESAAAASATPVTLPRVDRQTAPPPSAAAPITASEVARVAAPPPSVNRPSAPSWPPPAASVAQDLGALSGEMPLTLATLDGASEDQARASKKIALPASFAPPPTPAPAPPPVLDDDGGGDVDMDDDAPLDVFDPFAPPDQQTSAPELVLDRPARTASIPPTAGPTSATMAAAHATSGSHAISGSHALPATLAAPPTLPATTTPLPPRAPSDTAWKRLLRDDGTRLIAGALVAVAIGAVPALLIGGAREQAAFAELDDQLGKRQDAIKTREAWDGLDRVRATFLERKRAERQSIAITSLMIWVALSGGATWLWFRKIDWDRVLA